MNKKLIAILLTLCLSLGLFAGCGSSDETTIGEESTEDEITITGEELAAAYTNEYTIEDINIEEEAVALATTPAVSSLLMPTASGTSVKNNSKATIDYSNAADGYVMVKHQASTSKRLKVQVAKTGGTTYTYNLTAGDSYTTFPLSEGSGSYKVTVFENTTGSKYATVLSLSFSITLTDEFAPFLYPNQYVNYTASSKVVEKAAELTGDMTDTLEIVAAVYEYVVTNYSYDYDKASTVKSGYLPDLDAIYNAKKGICFDYAAVMTAMLRSRDIPTKLVVGYAGSAYHAWINVYTSEDGWITAAIYFDGSTWKLMDPTFASTGNQSESIMEYIENTNNYSAKYVY